MPRKIAEFQHFIIWHT